MNNPKRFVMVIDIDLCVGCRGCETACRQEHELKPRIGEKVNLKTERIPYWTKVETVGPMGKFPDLDMFYFPKLCNHCSDAPCVANCPTGAMHRREDGIILLDRSRCITCLKCLDSCPFQAIFYDKKEETLGKCDFCAHLVDHGLEPACVSTCLTRCRIFGDLNDPESAPTKILHENKDRLISQPIPWGKSGRPNVYYLHKSKKRL